VEGVNAIFGTTTMRMRRKRSLEVGNEFGWRIDDEGRRTKEDI